MILNNPWCLLLFLLFIPLIWWYLKKYRKGNPCIEISSTSVFNNAGSLSWKVVMLHALFMFRLLVIAALIIALCRPQTTDGIRSSQVEGTDIVLAIDVSGSMQAPDLEPNRFEAARDIASGFINERKHDNMSIVAFAGVSMSLMPLTNDKAALTTCLGNLSLGVLGDGTAIGDGLVSAINRVLGGKAKSKSIILLTDGTNNAGEVDPQTAAAIASQKGVRVYTIGIGTDGVVSVPDPFGFITTQVRTEIDEATLTNIANTTGGKYFRAVDNDALDQVFREIDTLEKTKLEIEEFSKTDENFMPWLWCALILFVIEMLLRYTVLRRIP